MRTKLVSVLAISALLFASCSNDDNTTPNTPQAVRFGASINKAAVPQVRAANDTWTASDAIGVFMVETGSAIIAESATNKQHTTTTGNSFAPVAGNEIYYPMDGTTKVDFIAYYPYLAGQVLGNYNVNVVSQTSQPKIDLLWSKADNAGAGYDKTSPGDIPLVFDHKLSKVIIKSTAGVGLSAAQLRGMTVTIKGMNTKATFDLSTGVLGTSDTPADIVPYTKTDGEVYEAIVLPADFAVDALTMTFTTVAGETFTWTNPTAADGKFEAGKQYTYTMTITRTGVDFTCIIINWMSVGSIEGTAE